MELLKHSRCSYYDPFMGTFESFSFDCYRILGYYSSSLREQCQISIAQLASNCSQTHKCHVFHFGGVTIYNICYHLMSHDNVPELNLILPDLPWLTLHKFRCPKTFFMHQNRFVFMFSSLPNLIGFCLLSQETDLPSLLNVKLGFNADSCLFGSVNSLSK